MNREWSTFNKSENIQDYYQNELKIGSFFAKMISSGSADLKLTVTDTGRFSEKCFEFAEFSFEKPQKT